MLIKCICTNCAGHLEFEEENAGETIPCPHCGFKTTLAGPEWERQKEESVLLAKKQRSRAWALCGISALLVIGGIGFVLYRWGIPWLQDAFPSVDTTTKATVVLLVACLVFPFALLWLVFPLMFLIHMIKTNEVLETLAAAQGVALDEDEAEEEAAEHQDIEPSRT